MMPAGNLRRPTARRTATRRLAPRGPESLGGTGDRWHVGSPAGVGMRPALVQGGGIRRWEMLMHYEHVFRHAVDRIRGEGRYRVFCDLARQAGAFPHAQALRGCRRRAAPDHRVVLQRLPRHGPASGGPGRRRRGGAHDGRGCRRHAQHLGHDAPARAPGARARGAARQAGGAAVHLGLRRQRGDAVHRLPPAARLRDLFGREEPRLDDRRHSPLGLRQADLPTQRRGASRGAARGERPRGAQADRVRVGLFDGRRLRADRRDLRCGGAPQRDDLPGRGARRRAVRPRPAAAGRGARA